MGDPLGALRRRVLADPAMCRRLATIEDHRAAVDALVALAREWGLALDAGDIQQATVAARRHWWEVWVEEPGRPSRFMGVDTPPVVPAGSRPTGGAADLDGWTPIRMHLEAGEAAVDWCYTAGERFDGAFFDQTVARCLRHPVRLLFRHRTPMAVLQEVAAGAGTLPLAGLVFHASRCGSTLVARMLAQLPSTLVLSEPAPLHTVLSASASASASTSASGATPSTSGAMAEASTGASASASTRAPSADPDPAAGRHLDWIRSMVAALAQRRDGAQVRAVVKLDAWAVLQVPWLRRAFPGVPLVFVYRDPVEVLVSHLGHRGWHMVPGALPAATVGLEAGDADRLPSEVYLARVLGAMLQAVGAACGEGDILLVNHRELPGAVADRIAPWLGMAIGDGDRATLAEVARWDAKNSCVRYQDDGAGKAARAGPELRAAVERWAQGPYEALEQHRAATP